VISAVALAAGRSRRMGAIKQLLPFGQHTVVEQVVATLLKCPVDEVLVVTGHRYAEVAQVLEAWPVRLAHNADYAAGEMLSLVQCGLCAIHPLGISTASRPARRACASTAAWPRTAPRSYAPGASTVAAISALK
jgi:hypothetical protein